MADVTKADLAALETRLMGTLDRIADQAEKLADYQREANGKVAALSEKVAVNEERLNTIKDNRGRLFTVVSALVVAFFSWALHVWKH